MTAEGGEQASMFCYELRLRSTLGPALLSSFPYIREGFPIRRETLFRFQTRSERTLDEVLSLLADRGVTVEAIRVMDGLPEAGTDQ
ncbi:hypothetical protein ACSMXN_06365 [Jatrophihabitans sp. DSM 45814]